MTVQPPAYGVHVAGDTNVGKVRTTNEDSLIVDPAHGLYAVLDGMGGGNAGDVASQMARDLIRDHVAQRRATMAPKALLEAAIQAACAGVFEAGQRHRERHGMGTTVVACLSVDDTHVIIGHVGDSRAYLLRAGRLKALTRDHTIVEELVDRGLLAAADADRHPYKNVLSRNLGARAETRVDLLELALEPGDRLMLCSDGLYGYAQADAIQYILGSGDAPEHVARDLIELAIRGGGGDNVSVIVVETDPAVQSSTQVVQTNGAHAWWQQRRRFLQLAEAAGLTRNEIVSGLARDEALDVVGLSLCQAIFHDLEKSTGINVWTFAQHLGGAWLEQGGDWAPLRAMVDILGTSARTVVGEIGAGDRALGFLLEVAVGRALVVAELALGGLLAERVRAIDAELIELHAATEEIAAPTLPPVQSEDTADQPFTDRPTLPFLRADRPVTHSGVSADLLAALDKALTIARARCSPRSALVVQALTALDTIAGDTAGNFAAAVQAARELYGTRPIDDSGIMPLFDALDQARILAAASVHQVQASESVRARVLRVVSAAQQRLVGAMAGLVLEAVVPYQDRLREAQTVTAKLRGQVARAERKRAELERSIATQADPGLPWGSRGTTEW